MKIGFHTIIFLLLSLIVTQNSHAKNIMCWQNKQKIRECGGTVPPEYAQQRIEILNEQGMVVKVIEPRKSKADLAREAREAEKKEAIDERRRQDMILLQTFTTEQDLLDSRDKKVASLEGTISIANGNLRILSNNLEQLQKQAANHERAGSAIPKQLVADIDSVKNQIAENEKYLAGKQKAHADILDKFADDLQRYRQLKQVKPR